MNREEEMLIESEEPMHEIRFGAVPSLQEMEEATTGLEDALDNQLLPLSLLGPAQRRGSITSEEAVQSIVAAIASDPNVWDAVMKNESVREFIESQKRTNAQSHNSRPPKKIADASDDDNSQSGSSKNGFKDLFQSIKTSVVEMVSNVSAFIQTVFGFPSADRNAKLTFTDMAMGATLMGLAVMTIIAVKQKRA